MSDTGDHPMLNREAVSELVEVLGVAHVREILAKFLDDTRTRLGTIERAVAARRMSEVCDHLHMLKSTAATLGLSEMARLALELEAEAGRAGIDVARFGALKTMFDESVGTLLAAFPELG
jgi:HPt (histidine-containing phosphotransfer) domain-containing protein